MLRPYLQLVRLPLVFTALGDPLAAALGSGATCTPRLAGLSLASGLCYLGGMALNDLADLRRDTLAGKARPLARREIPPIAALLVALGLLGAGAALALALGAPQVLFLLAAILLYDLAAKRHWVAGALAMAACRYGNALLGLPSDEGWPWDAALPWILFLHTLGLTLVSELEDRPPDGRGRLIAGLALASLTGGAVLVLSLCARPLLAVPLLLGGALWLRGDAHAALRTWQPRILGRWVGKLVASLIVVDAAWLLGQDRALWGLALLALIVPAHWGAARLRRWEVCDF